MKRLFAALAIAAALLGCGAAEPNSATLNAGFPYCLTADDMEYLGTAIHTRDRALYSELMADSCRRSFAPGLAYEVIEQGFGIVRVRIMTQHGALDVWTYAEAVRNNG